MDELDKLHADWKLTRPDYKLINDGILNNEKWALSKSKVLFLLKESYGFFQIRNKSHLITLGEGNHFWYNISRWWLSIDKYYNNQTLEFPSNNQLRESHPMVSEIAYVNIKKSAEGKRKSSPKDIMNYAKKDKDLLRRQIDLIAPKVIITDKTTFNSYKAIYSGDEFSLEKTSNPKVFKHRERYIIRFYHPSYFGREASWLFNELQKCLEVIKRNQ